MGIETKRKDLGAEHIKKMMRQIEESKPFVKIGVLSPQTHLAVLHKGQKQPAESPPTTLQIATWMEYGTKRVPERSFLRSTRIAYYQEMRNVIGRVFQQVLKGRFTIDQGLGLVGEEFRSFIRLRIKAGIAPANAQSTIDRKGSSKPLVDSGQLVASINYKTYPAGGE